MQSIRHESKKELISYEEWLKKSQMIFKQTIAKEAHHTFDEKDHQIATEKNQYISDMLTSLENNKWYVPKTVDKTHKAFQIWDFIKTLNRDIMSIDPIQASSYTLMVRIKLCLHDIKIIDPNLIKNAKTNSKWFYELLQTQNITPYLDKIINELDKRMRNYIELFNASLPPPSVAPAPLRPK